MKTKVEEIEQSIAYLDEMEMEVDKKRHDVMSDILSEMNGDVILDTPVRAEFNHVDYPVMVQHVILDKYGDIIVGTYGITNDGKEVYASYRQISFQSRIDLYYELVETWQGM